MDKSAWMVRRKKEFTEYILDICEGGELDFDKIAVEALNPLRGAESSLRALRSRQVLGRLRDFFTGKGQQLLDEMMSNILVAAKTGVGLFCVLLELQKRTDDDLADVQVYCCELKKEVVPGITAKLDQLLRHNERFSTKSEHLEVLQDLDGLRADSQQLGRGFTAKLQQLRQDFTAKLQQLRRDQEHTVASLETELQSLRELVEDALPGLTVQLQQKTQDIDQLKAKSEQQSQDIDLLRAESQQKTQDSERETAMRRLSSRFAAGTLNPGTGRIFGAARYLAQVQRVWAAAPPEKQRQEIELAFDVATSKLGGDSEPLAEVLLRAANEIEPEALELAADLLSQASSPASQALYHLVRQRMEGRNLSMELAEQSIATAKKFKTPSSVELWLATWHKELWSMDQDNEGPPAGVEWWPSGPWICWTNQGKLYHYRLPEPKTCKILVVLLAGELLCDAN